MLFRDIRRLAVELDKIKFSPRIIFLRNIHKPQPFHACPLLQQKQGSKALFFLTQHVEYAHIFHVHALLYPYDRALQTDHILRSVAVASSSLPNAHRRRIKRFSFSFPV